MPERIVPLALGAWLLLAPGAQCAADEVLARSCDGCHAQSTIVPRIQGVDAALLEDALLKFKRDEREATVMNRIAKGYTDAELTALARYFATHGGEP